MASIAVIVPVHNAGMFIEECAGSILPQLRSGDKLILVDDASTDNSFELMQDIAAADSAKVELLHSHGRGVSSARNTGIAAAKTDYIAFCDADDAYAPGGLRLLVQALDGDSHIDIAVGTMLRTMPPEANGEYLAIESTEALYQTLYQRRGYHESAWAKVYRRKLFRKDTLFTEGRRYEDLEQTARIYLKARKIAFYNCPVYYYRPNSGSFLASVSHDRADAVWACETILHTVSRQTPQLVRAARSRLFSAVFNIFGISRRTMPDIHLLCWHKIKQQRCAILTDRNSRLKNRIAALFSFAGRRVCAFIAEKIVYR